MGIMIIIFFYALFTTCFYISFTYMLGKLLTKVITFIGFWKSSFFTCFTFLKPMEEIVMPHQVKLCSPKRAAQYSWLYNYACLLIFSTHLCLTIQWWLTVLVDGISVCRIHLNQGSWIWIAMIISILHTENTSIILLLQQGSQQGVGSENFLLSRLRSDTPLTCQF